jgi:hypothetical protein
MADASKIMGVSVGDYGKLLGVEIGSVVPTLIPQATGTIIGDMTSQGALSVSFNGTTDSTNNSEAVSLYGSPTTGYVGKDYGGSFTTVVKQAIIYPFITAGFSSIGSETGTLNVRGSASSPSSPSDGTLLGSNSFTDPTSDPVTIDCSANSTAYQYVWIEWVCGENPIGAEIEFYGV